MSFEEQDIKDLNTFMTLLMWNKMIVIRHYPEKLGAELVKNITTTRITFENVILNLITDYRKFFRKIREYFKKTNADKPYLDLPSNVKQQINDLLDKLVIDYQEDESKLTESTNYQETNEIVKIIEIGFTSDEKKDDPQAVIDYLFSILTKDNYSSVSSCIYNVLFGRNVEVNAEGKKNKSGRMAKLVDRILRASFCLTADYYNNKLTTTHLALPNVYYCFYSPLPNFEELRDNDEKEKKNKLEKGELTTAKFLSILRHSHYYFDKLMNVESKTVQLHYYFNIFIYYNSEKKEEFKRVLNPVGQVTIQKNKDTNPAYNTLSVEIYTLTSNKDGHFKVLTPTNESLNILGVKSKYSKILFESNIDRDSALAIRSKIRRLVTEYLTEIKNKFEHEYKQELTSEVLTQKDKYLKELNPNVFSPNELVEPERTALNQMYDKLRDYKKESEIVNLIKGKNTSVKVFHFNAKPTPINKIFSKLIKLKSDELVENTPSGTDTGTDTSISTTGKRKIDKRKIISTKQLQAQFYDNIYYTLNEQGKLTNDLMDNLILSQIHHDETIFNPLLDRDFIDYKSFDEDEEDSEIKRQMIIQTQEPKEEEPKEEELPRQESPQEGSPLELNPPQEEPKEEELPRQESPQEGSPLELNPLQEEPKKKKPTPMISSNELKLFEEEIAQLRSDEIEKDNQLKEDLTVIRGLEERIVQLSSELEKEKEEKNILEKELQRADQAVERLQKENAELKKGPEVEDKSVTPPPEPTIPQILTSVTVISQGNSPINIPTKDSATQRTPEQLIPINYLEAPVEEPIYTFQTIDVAQLSEELKNKITSEGFESQEKKDFKKEFKKAFLDRMKQFVGEKTVTLAKEVIDGLFKISINAYSNPEYEVQDDKYGRINKVGEVTKKLIESDTIKTENWLPNQITNYYLFRMVNFINNFALQCYYLISEPNSLKNTVQRLAMIDYYGTLFRDELIEDIVGEEFFKRKDMDYLRKYQGNYQVYIYCKALIDSILSTLKTHSTNSSDTENLRAIVESIINSKTLIAPNSTFNTFKDRFSWPSFPEAFPLDERLKDRADNIIEELLPAIYTYEPILSNWLAQWIIYYLRKAYNNTDPRDLTLFDRIYLKGNKPEFALGVELEPLDFQELVTGTLIATGNFSKNFNSFESLIVKIAIGEKTPLSIAQLLVYNYKYFELLSREEIRDGIQKIKEPELINLPEEIPDNLMIGLDDTVGVYLRKATKSIKKRKQKLESLTDYISLDFTPLTKYNFRRDQNLKAIREKYFRKITLPSGRTSKEKYLNEELLPLRNKSLIKYSKASLDVQSPDFESIIATFPPEDQLILQTVTEEAELLLRLKKYENESIKRFESIDALSDSGWLSMFNDSSRSLAEDSVSRVLTSFNRSLSKINTPSLLDSLIDLSSELDDDLFGEYQANAEILRRMVDEIDLAYNRSFDFSSSIDDSFPSIPLLEEINHPINPYIQPPVRPNPIQQTLPVDQPPSGCYTIKLYSHQVLNYQEGLSPGKMFLLENEFLTEITKSFTNEKLYRRLSLSSDCEIHLDLISMCYNYLVLNNFEENSTIGTDNSEVRIPAIYLFLKDFITEYLNVIYPNPLEVINEDAFYNGFIIYNPDIEEEDQLKIYSGGESFLMNDPQVSPFWYLFGFQGVCVRRVLPWMTLSIYINTNFNEERNNKTSGILINLFRCNSNDVRYHGVYNSIEIYNPNILKSQISLNFVLESDLRWHLPQGVINDLYLIWQFQFSGQNN